MSYLLAAAPAHVSPLLGYMVLSAAVVVWAFGYVVVCAIWPFANCRKCTGSGKRRSPSGKAWRRCRRCKGGGARLRLGRRVWNRARRLHREAQ